VQEVFMASKGKKPLVQADKSSDSEFVRRFKTNPLIFVGTIVVLVIVVIAFVFVPAISPGARKVADLTFGYYDKIPISYVPGNFFAQYYERLSQYYRNMGDMYNNIFFEQQMWREAFEQTAYRTAVLQEIKKSGYSVPEKTVDKAVAQQFMENGRFSATLYNRFDNNSRLAMWRRTQEDLAMERYHSDIDNLVNSEQAAQFIGKMASVRRSFDFVSFPVNDYPNSEIVTYAQQNAELFRQIHLSRITVVSGEREARQILQSITNGSTTFEDAARAHSQDAFADRGGDLGIKQVHELLTEIPGETEREQVIALGKGELSDVLKIEAGWGIFRVEETVQPVDFDDIPTMDRVRLYIQTFERGRMEDWAYGNAEQFIALVKEKGFDEALYENNLTKQSFGPIPINYGEVDLFEKLSSASMADLSGASGSEDFWKTSFGTPINTPSEPFVQGGNVLVFFPVSEEEADKEAINDIVSSYSNYWLINTAGTSMRSYFLNSDKMDDRFFETFIRYFMPQDY
jgi:hypothetical protein